MRRGDEVMEVMKLWRFIDFRFAKKIFEILSAQPNAMNFHNLITS